MLQRVCLALTAAAGLCACAARQELPVARTVCVLVPQETEQEVAYVRKKVAANLQDWGYALVDDGCDVTVKYQRFGAFQGESIGRGFWGTTRDGYWSQEGILSVTANNGKTLIEDYSVALRGYSTKQLLLDDLGYRLANAVTWYYRPVPKAGK